MRGRLGERRGGTVRGRTLGERGEERKGFEGLE